MGVVYAARHASLDRRAAVKILPQDLAALEITRRRFEREWRTTASLRHPNIVPIYDAGESDGVLYLAMQLIDGPDLAAFIRNAPGGRLELADIVPIVKQVASALGAAHAAGVIHRDVKPGNVLIEGEHCYLTDFGLSKLNAGSSTLTQAGRAIGTAHYLAPEQIKAAKVDERTDVYGLGGLAYEALTGAPPFLGDSDITVLFAQLNTAARPVSERRPGLPEAVDEVVASALAKSPEQRYATPAEFADALERTLDAG